MELVNLVKSSEFFKGLDEEEIASLLTRCNAVKKTLDKGEAVVHAGFRADRLHIVADGLLHCYEQTTDDRLVLVREIGRGEVLGLWILFLPEAVSWPGTTVAAQDTTVVSLDMARLFAYIETCDKVAARLSVNASRGLSRELLSTWRKLIVMDAQTIEERIRVYLAELDGENGRTGTVTIPFDRERMAEYFGVTRPALSRTLGLMRDRGLLSWRKNVFHINF